MGHANVDVTQNAYGRSWWEELVEMVERTIDAVFSELESQLVPHNLGVSLSN